MTGADLKQKGMQLSLFGAGDEWKQRATTAFHAFLAQHTGTFMTEDVRTYAYSHGFIETKNKRAWGALVCIFHNQGHIKFVTYGKVKNAKAHCATASIWTKN